MKTWVTPLGIELTVAGQGGPWKTITPHAPVAKSGVQPLVLPIPHGVDKGWYYRGGWQPPKGDK